MHLLKGGATTTTHIRVKLLCADRMLTCGSYPSACRDSTTDTPHTSLRLSLTRSLGLTSALAGSLKRSASTSGSPSSSSSGSHPIQAEGILSPEVVRPSPRWLTSWLLILRGVGVYLLEGGCVSPGMVAAVARNQKELWRPWPWM